MEGVYEKEEIRTFDHERHEPVKVEVTINLPEPEERETLGPVVIPAPVVVTPPVPFRETHLGKSMTKGGVLGVALAIAGNVASKTFGFQFVWEFASGGGLLFFLYSYHNDPKYRFSKAASWILSTWLFIGNCCLLFSFGLMWKMKILKVR